MSFKDRFKQNFNKRVQSDSRVLSKSKRKKGEYAITMFIGTCLMLPLYVVFGLIINLLSLYTDAYEKLSKNTEKEAKEACGYNTVEVVD